MQLTPNLTNGTFTINTFFLPYNFGTLNANDLDFGVTESLLFPGTQNVLAGCKDGNMYLMNGNSMGGYTNGGPNANQQTISLGQNASQHASYAYYNNGTGKEYVYIMAENSALKAFPYDRISNTVGNPTISGVQGPIGQSGAFLSVSSNGSAAGTGILWAVHAIAPCNANQEPTAGLCQGILRAFDANDVTKETWNSSENISDTLGLYAKFVCPTIANGKVYMVTFSGKLVVYGITGASPCPGIQNVADFHNNAAATYSASSNANTAVNAFDGNLNTAWVGENSDGFSKVQEVTVNLGSIYNLCRVVVNWGSTYSGQYFIQGSNDNITYQTIASISDNTSQYNVFYLQGQSWQYIRMQGNGQSNFSSGLTVEEMQVYATPSNGCIAPTNLNSSNITQNTATYSWTPVAGATSYNFQYKTSAVSTWTTISQSSTTVNLSGLACGTDYLIQVQAVCAAGNSPFTPSAFSTSACTVSCTLPTRWTSVDVGTTNVAGSACLNAGVYTLQGSGADIGGTADAFHYAYFTLPVDETIIATVETQDAPNPNNKAGIIIRETTNPDSRFAFIGLTSGNGVVFEYRSTTGATAVSSFSGSSVAAPYWIKLVKNGSSYSGYMSPDGNTWTQVGATVDLGFGSGVNVFAGFAITSHNIPVLSTATIDNMLEQTNPLAIKLSGFTAQNVNNQYVQLQWSTSQEVNNNYFLVQRSVDGIHYSDIINVPGAGNSNITLNYSAQDDHAVQGINYYRLKEVDFDGKFSYSAVIPVRFGQQVAPMIYPNPARSYFTIVAGQDPVKSVSVFDVSGKVTRKISYGSGVSALTVYCADMAPGVYIIQISTNTQNYIRKLIRQ
jgi:hypothetical protein